jgi:hypothetical protein
MQSEEVMPATRCLAKVLKGLSFEIADLNLIKGRIRAYDLNMVILVDHGSDVEEYEEVLVFYSVSRPSYRWMMWRTANAVFMRSTDGRIRRYRTAALAIKSLVRKEGVARTA